jgi:hypothetical protein
MSLDTVEAASQAIGAFWHNIRRTRRRDASSPPASMRGAMQESIGSRREMHVQTQHRAESPRVAARPALTAEDLADSYIKSLARGDYGFRVLKGEFDELCVEAEIAPVSDKQFAHWLLARGHRKWREGYPKVTMYRIAPARKARAA